LSDERLAIGQEEGDGRHSLRVDRELDGLNDDGCFSDDIAYI
jgi:hypothetical protein